MDLFPVQRSRGEGPAVGSADEVSRVELRR
jgi:hypothetical protein